jgi:hypothetical protein
MIFCLYTAGRGVVVSVPISYLRISAYEPQPEALLYWPEVCRGFLRSSRQRCWNIVQHTNHTHLFSMLRNS